MVKQPVTNMEMNGNQNVFRNIKYTLLVFKMWYEKDTTQSDQTVPEETLFLIKAINPLQSHFTMTKEKKEQNTPLKSVEIFK